VESTWWNRDLPVLDAAVRLFQEQDFVEVRDLARETGLDPNDVAHALLDMRYEYVSEVQSMGDKEDWSIDGVTAAARRAVGQWPTPANIVASLAVAFSRQRSRSQTPSAGASSGRSPASWQTPARTSPPRSWPRSSRTRPDWRDEYHRRQLATSYQP
jgi:hypothetical protein